MAMLQKAAEQEKSDKPEKSEDKSAEPKKHKKKHPAAPPSVPPEGGDAAGDAAGDDASDSQSPDAGGDDSADSGAPDAGAAQQPQDSGSQPDAGQAGPQGDDGNNAQPGGQQGATPVPNPQAPGAGVEEGGDDTPDNEDEATGGTPDANAPTPAGAPGAQGGPAGASLTQVPLSPALKEEYANLDKQLVTALYQQGLAEKIMPSLFPQGPHKLKGVIQPSVILARELMLKTKAPLQLALPFARDVAAHIMQIGEQVKQIQYSDQESTAIFGSVYEGIMHAFGVKKSQFQQVAGVVPRSQFAKHAQAYTQAHGHAKAAAAANQQQEHAEDVQQTPPAAAGGPQGLQGAGPPQAGGGMLAQAAAQQPQQGAEQPEQQGGEQEAQGG